MRQYYPSMDEGPVHQLCPKGLSSWFFYIQAIAAEETPAAAHIHKKKKKCSREEYQMTSISASRKSTAQDFFIWYFKGITQNKNKSLHGKPWNKCWKIKHVGHLWAKFVARMAALECSFGREANLIHILQAMETGDKESEQVAGRKKRKVKKQL